MNRPDWYQKANSTPRYEAQRVFEDYSKKMQWRQDGHDSLIDLGSGPGDVLMDFVYPRVPKNFQRLICSDINPKMVNYASAQYGHIDRVEFKIFDMAMEKNLPSDLKGQFDHVTSFYALMLVQNQRQALHNMIDLLRPEGGDCLLSFLASHPIFNAYKLMSQLEKWSKYMYNVDKMMPPSQHSKQPGNNYAQLLSEVGFRNYTVDVQHREYVYDNLQEFKANMKAVNPFLDRIPDSLHAVYMDDLISMYFKGLNMPEKKEEYNCRFSVSYRLVIVFARK